MAYSALKLISKSLYLSGIVSRSLQAPTGDQITDGLELLNLLISTKAYDKGFIPYFTQYSFNSVIGQEKYFVPNMVEIETVTFNIGTVRFPSTERQRKDYFGSARVDGLNSLPFSWHAERSLGGTDIYLYFNPVAAYPMKAWGKFAFSDVTLATDLLLVYDEYYVNYLKSELAAYFCNDYGIPLQPQVATTLESMRYKMRDQSPIDLTVSKISRFGNDINAMGFGYASLGRGYVPY